MTIGIYDSGLGAICVARRQVSAPLIYFGDTARLPTATRVQTSSWTILRQPCVLSRGCTGLVVACNTTSSVVLPRIEHLVKLPWWAD